MSFRPAGDSSDEDDEFYNFSMDSDYKNEKETKAQNAKKVIEERQRIENLPVNIVYNAIVSGNLEVVVKELNNDFDIESYVFKKFTPLHLAASVGKFEIVNELLTRGANVKIEDEGFNVLMAACSCLKNTTSSENILHIVKKLLEHDINVIEVDRKRRTALMLACEQGFIEVVELLQPLSNLEAEDNQGWTALFYAIQGKNTEIFSFLYNMGANYNHNDIFDNNVKYYATINELDDILRILPYDGDIAPETIIQNDYNYEEMFEYLENNPGHKPSFKEDIAALLYGMKCENLISLFNGDNIDLHKFLTITDVELEINFDVKMSFQRIRILQGLYRFHEQGWKRTSVPYVSKNETYTTFDLFEIITTAVKHIVIMEATLDYLEKNYSFFQCDRLDIIASKIHEIQKKINGMKTITKHLHKRAKKFDKIGFHSDMIRKGFSFRKNSLVKTIAMSFVGLSTIVIFACCKTKFFKIL